MILVARHGETNWNRLGRMQGQRNSQLTDRGVHQAERLSEFINKFDVNRIISSPLGRAIETSKIVKARTNLPLCSEERIKEIDFGEFSGHSEEYLRQKKPKFWARREQNKWNYEWPNGESYSDAYNRVGSFVENEDKLQKSVIIAHQSLNRVLIGQLLDMDPRELLEIDQPNNVIYGVTENSELRRWRYEDLLPPFS
ncbi:histidine phosphatase family protein [Haloquadratum walsbyi]|uniref:CobC/GpmA family phosphatase n=1 Tax=Haloquadratum walsbyi (strain DSM 16790 / HBSQ001) TaxID=362976 RepID=Q18EL5_HALWD|nr:histidine phosphatase family protein [Haloquadratum walsbyi]CAJ53608.1 CobC/GpmA family phosphatase [Haloquadratum walsbyi DSM 16790]